MKDNRLDAIIIEVRHGRMSNTKAKQEISEIVKEIIGEPERVKEGSQPCDVLAFYQGDIRERARERGLEI